MAYPYGRQPHHRQEDHEEERREHQHHNHGFQPSEEFPRPPSAGEYYPPPGTQFPEPGYYPPPPQPQSHPYSQVEHHAHQPFSQVEEHHAYSPFSRVEHHAHQPFSQVEEHHGRPPFSQVEEHQGRPPFSQVEEHHGRPPFSQVEEHHGRPPFSQVEEHHAYSPFSRVEHHAHPPFSQVEEHHGRPPFSQVEEHHGRPPFSQVEEHHAHQGSGHVVHHESDRPFQRPECETPSGPESSFGRPGYGPPGGSFPRPGGEPVLPRGQVVRVFNKAGLNFSLAIRNGSVVLVHQNDNDKLQQWVMDETYSTKVKDEASSPSFSLVNKATGQALKHGLGETQPVLLTEYRPNNFDESTLWTMSGDISQGYRTIRLVNNIHLNLDAFHGDKKSGGIKDGNPIVLWSWKKGDNQLWKIVPY